MNKMNAKAVNNTNKTINPSPNSNKGQGSSHSKKPTPAALAKGMFRALRPHQWIKNILVFAGIIFDAKLPRAEWFSHPNIGEVLPLINASIAFIIFCAMSSSVYLFNDIRDFEQDRHHPKKSKRPIASGLVPINLAIGMSVFLLIFGLGASAYLIYGFQLLSWKFLILASIYLLIQLGYTLGLKHILILDICIIASGFVLRAMAGTAAANLYISPWLILCTGLLSLLIGFGKRRHELILLGEKSGDHRAALKEYTTGLIDQLITISASCAIVAYCVYAVQSPTAQINYHMYLTIAPVIYGIFRYIYLLHQGNTGGSPEKDLFTDPHVLLSIFAFFVIAVITVVLPNAHNGVNLK